MAYSKVEWKDNPEGGTPLNASNLDKMDSGILTNSNNISTLQSDVTSLQTSVSTINTKVNGLGTASTKSYTTSVSSSSALVTSGAVKTELDKKSNLLSVTNFVSGTITIAADGNEDGSITVTKSGCTPIAVAGWRVVNASSSDNNYLYVVPLNLYVSGNTVKYHLTNYAEKNSGKTSKVKLSVNVLYKNT